MATDSFVIGEDEDERFDCLDLAMHRNGLVDVIGWQCPGQARCQSDVCVEKCCRQHHSWSTITESKDNPDSL